jgi:hypothetical protein
VETGVTLGVLVVEMFDEASHVVDVEEELRGGGREEGGGRGDGGGGGEGYFRFAVWSLASACSSAPCIHT